MMSVLHSSRVDYFTLAPGPPANYCETFFNNFFYQDSQSVDRLAPGFTNRLRLKFILD